jgi:hypothetical protein
MIDEIPNINRLSSIIFQQTSPQSRKNIYLCPMLFAHQRDEIGEKLFLLNYWSK